MNRLHKEIYLKKYPYVEEYIDRNNIDFEELEKVYDDFVKYQSSYETQADFIANILRSNENIHSVKSRIKNPERLIEKIIRIEVRSRQSGYRSVHYLVECYPTNQKVIAEIQVRTIFEEGYGEIDHRLRYSHHEIPEILKSNLLLFNRIVGSADEMASLINMLNNNLGDKENYYENKLREKDEEIQRLNEELEKYKTRIY